MVILLYLFGQNEKRTTLLAAYSHTCILKIRPAAFAAAPGV